MDEAKFERVARWAAEDGLLPEITEVLQGVIHAPGQYTPRELQNMRDALTLFSGYTNEVER